MRLPLKTIGALSAVLLAAAAPALATQFQKDGRSTESTQLASGGQERS